MSAKQMETDQVREHVNRAHDVIGEFRRDGISALLSRIRSPRRTGPIMGGRLCVVHSVR
jgi:hypothetical protein